MTALVDDEGGLGKVAFLTNEEIRIACELAAEIGIDYAKTASGQFDGPSMDQFLISLADLVAFGAAPALMIYQ